MILVVGSTSSVGTRVIPQLLAQGEKVRAMTREPSKPEAERLKELGAEVVQGDLRDPGLVVHACQGIKKVLAAAHGFAPGQTGNTPRTVDDVGNRNLIDAAKGAGVEHFVFISVLGASPTSSLDFFRIKYSAEQYLQKSGLSYTILRAAAFMEFWAVMVGEPILMTGKTTIFGRGNNPINFVSAEDVAKFSVMALLENKARNQVIEIGGPENLTFNQVAELFEEVSGRPAKKKHVPLPMLHVMRLLSRPFNPILSKQITAGILMDTKNQVYDMNSTLERYPIKQKRLNEIAQQMAEKIKL
jgi:uncharacterized protein YbjT (DUF2867 family)